ncbi:MAG: hypothetical protein ABEI06_08980 [Halobacteriaceae archaeon]
MDRKSDVDHLYDLLDRLADRVGGPKTLDNCHGRMNWPERGIYIFFAADETRDSSDQRRITRVGTHAVSTGSSTSLWNRLITHRGTFSGKYAGGGNHRGSVFRLRVGEAMIEREGLHDEYPEWGEGTSAGSDLREQELEHERRVSSYIRELPFLWIKVNDEPGPESLRGYFERNIIGLLSNYNREPIDPRNSSWLGNDSPNAAIRKSGLWNVDHVSEDYDPTFFEKLEMHIEKTTSV